MKIKPEDRPKMIGLLTAIGIMFCYLILVVVPSLSGAQAAPAAQETPETGYNAPAPLVNAPAPSLTTSDNHPGAMMDAGPVPDAKNDPFLSPSPNAATAVSSAPSAPPAVTAASKPTTPLVTTPIVTTPPAASVPPTPPSASETLPPSLTLLGVADGEEPVAVFQVGESTLEKKKGDALPGGFRLQTIDADGVTLARGKAVFRLEVGHSQTGTGQ